MMREWVIERIKHLLPASMNPARGVRWTLLAAITTAVTGLIVFAVAVSQTSLPGKDTAIKDVDTASLSPEVHSELQVPVLASVSLMQEAASQREAEMLAVAVRGAVRLPGLYRLPTESRVHDLIRRAGGALEEADLDDINIAAYLLDGTTLSIPSRPIRAYSGETMILRGANRATGENPPGYTRSGWRPVDTAHKVFESKLDPDIVPTASPVDGRIDINHATQKELETLPGIGPKTAEKIIAYRSQTPFVRIEDIQNVSGIAAGKFDAIRDLIAVRQ